jgi:hypothetical protein
MRGGGGRVVGIRRVCVRGERGWVRGEGGWG